MAEGQASARSALAGNPSDGYGGAVLSLSLPDLSARASAVRGAGSLDPASELVAATIDRFARSFAVDASVDVTWETAIPRSVGLAGSSAVVIAVARALCALHQVALGPDDLAEFAHAVERVDLAIAGGRQDSVCQAHGGLVFMDFAGEPPVAERLDPSLLPPLVVAWRVDSAEDSDVVHSDLRTRYRSRDAVVVGAMATLAAAARRARASLLGGDHNGFAQAVDATFDSRREILTLDPRHVEMVAIARRAGAAANYSGSGGSIVAVCRDASHCRSVTAGLMAAGCGATTATRARP